MPRRRAFSSDELDGNQEEPISIDTRKLKEHLLETAKRRKFELGVDVYDWQAEWLLNEIDGVAERVYATATPGPVALSLLSELLSEPGVCGVLLEYLPDPCIRVVLPLVSKSFRAASSANVYWADAFQRRYGNSAACRALVQDCGASEFGMDGAQWKEAYKVVWKSVAATKESWDEDTMAPAVCTESLIAGKEDDDSTSHSPIHVISDNCFAVVGTEIITILKTSEAEQRSEEDGGAYNENEENDDNAERGELFGYDCVSGKSRRVPLPDFISSKHDKWVFKVDEEAILLLRKGRKELAWYNTKTLEEEAPFSPAYHEGINIVSYAGAQIRETAMDQRYVIALYATFEGLIGVAWDRATRCFLSSFELCSPIPVHHEVSLRCDGLLSVLMELRDEEDANVHKCWFVLLDPRSGNVLVCDVFDEAGKPDGEMTSFACHGRYILTSHFEADPTAVLYNTRGSNFSKLELDPSQDFLPANGAIGSWGNTVLLGSYGIYDDEEAESFDISCSEIYMYELQEQDEEERSVRCKIRKTLWSSNDEESAIIRVPSNWLVVAAFHGMSPSNDDTPDDGVWRNVRRLRMWDFTIPSVAKLRSAFHVGK